MDTAVRHWNNDKTAQFWIFLIAFLVAAAGYFKGFNGGIQFWGQPYWVIDYSDGLIKRALLGQIFTSLYPQGDLYRTWAAVLALHTMMSWVLIGGVLMWARDRMHDSVISAIALLFAASQFVPTLAYNTGYLDVYLYVMLLTGVMLLAARQVWPIVLLGLVGSFIHESFVFVWVSLMVLVVVEAIEERKWTIERTAIIAAPVAGAALIYLFHSQDAAISQMQGAPLPQEIKDGMIQTQFGQRITSTMRNMLFNHFMPYWGNFIQASIFFGAPAAAMVGLYAMGRRLSLLRVMAILAAGAAPLSILIFAWDLSRFLVATSLSSIIVILYAETAWRPVPRPTPRALTIAAYALASIYVLLPFVYAYFNTAAMLQQGVLPVEDWLFGVWAQHWLDDLYIP